MSTRPDGRTGDAIGDSDNRKADCRKLGDAAENEKADDGETAAEVLDLNFQGMAVIIARGVLGALDDKSGELLMMVSAETEVLLFSIRAIVFRKLAGWISRVLIGAGFGRLSVLEAEKPAWLDLALVPCELWELIVKRNEDGLLGEEDPWGILRPLSIARDSFPSR